MILTGLLVAHVEVRGVRVLLDVVAWGFAWVVVARGAGLGKRLGAHGRNPAITNALLPKRTCARNVSDQRIRHLIISLIALWKYTKLGRARHAAHLLVRAPSPETYLNLTGGQTALVFVRILYKNCIRLSHLSTLHLQLCILHTALITLLGSIWILFLLLCPSFFHFRSPFLQPLLKFLSISIIWMHHHFVTLICQQI